MKTYSTDHALTEAFRTHEDRVAYHLRDAELRRTLPRPASALRVRVARALHALADRLEPRPALRPTPHTPCT